MRTRLDPRKLSCIQSLQVLNTNKSTHLTCLKIRQVLRKEILYSLPEEVGTSITSL